MKKVYRAPEIVFESFSLNVSIATGCAAEANATKGTCGYQLGWDMIIFLEGIYGCADVVEEPKDNDGYCYHNPSDDTRLFGS